jgi:hypothetical protein
MLTLTVVLWPALPALRNRLLPEPRSPAAKLATLAASLAAALDWLALEDLVPPLGTSTTGASCGPFGSMTGDSVGCGDRAVLSAVVAVLTLLLDWSSARVSCCGVLRVHVIK